MLASCAAVRLSASRRRACSPRSASSSTRDARRARAACARIARRIHDDRLRVVGFVPSDDKVAVPPLIIHLGLALCDLTGATVAVVDANVRYPGLADARPTGTADRPRRFGVLDALAARLARAPVAAARRARRRGRAAARARAARRRGPVRARARRSHRLRAARRARDAPRPAWTRSPSSAARTRRGRHELVELARLMPHGRFLGVCSSGDGSLACDRTCGRIVAHARRLRATRSWSARRDAHLEQEKIAVIGLGYVGLPGRDLVRHASCRRSASTFASAASTSSRRATTTRWRSPTSSSRRRRSSR